MPTALRCAENTLLQSTLIKRMRNRHVLILHITDSNIENECKIKGLIMKSRALVKPILIEYYKTIPINPIIKGIRT